MVDQLYPSEIYQLHTNLQNRKIINLNQLIVKEYKLNDINIPIKKMLSKKSSIGRYLIKM